MILICSVFINLILINRYPVPLKEPYRKLAIFSKMNNRSTTIRMQRYVLLLCILMASCQFGGKERKEQKVTIQPGQADVPTSEQIHQLIEQANSSEGRINDSTRLYLPHLVQHLYEENSFVNLWSTQHRWKPLADSVLNFLHQAEQYGLFPNAYHQSRLQQLHHQLKSDSAARASSFNWALADVLLTDACLHSLKDLKYGRLWSDSADLSNDSSIRFQYLADVFTSLLNQGTWSKTLQRAEPIYRGYHELKAAIPDFLDSMDRRVYTYVPYPFKRGDSTDSVKFIASLQQRLYEARWIGFQKPLPDSAQLDQAIRNYQRKKNLTVDGKFGAELIRSLNATDVERFKQIAITLDRYKQFPDSLPQKYIWVNLPGSYLQVWDHDSLALESKVICGAPTTRTPLLTSKITDMVTYPTWTVPTSIISKQYLPKLKTNPNYLNKLGLRLLNQKGENVDPATVSWGKYTRGIPFKVMQASGDNNALGVMKFNFNNEYAVYLHDTNQRYLFQKKNRALSHGCVRVQEWEQLAFYLLRNDSAMAAPGDTLRYNADSIRNWIAAKKHRRIDVKDEVTLFIYYLSCEGKNGRMKFYDDIYGEDKALREKYFADRTD